MWIVAVIKRGDTPLCRTLTVLWSRGHTLEGGTFNYDMIRKFFENIDYMLLFFFLKVLTHNFEDCMPCTIWRHNG